MIELYALAWIYRDDALIADLVDHDIHARTAARVNGIPIEAVTKSQRDGAKAINYGSIYGITAPGLRQNVFADYGVVWTVAEAQHALDQFAKAYPRAWEGRQRNAEACWKQGYIVIPTSGRIVRRGWLYDRRGLTFQRCSNTPVQGAAADSMLTAVSQMHICLTEARLQAALIATVHDELLVECPESEAEMVRAPPGGSDGRRVRRNLSRRADQGRGRGDHRAELGRGKSMILRDWRPYVSGGLRGYARIELDIGLMIPGNKVLVGTNGPFVTLPAAGAAGRQAEARCERQANLCPDGALEGPRDRRQVQPAVIRLLLAKYPDALGAAQ